MRLVCDPLFSEVVLMALAEELSRLAGAVADGEGLLSSTASPGSNDLAGVEVRKTSGPGVLIHLDPERQILVISGDFAGSTSPPLIQSVVSQLGTTTVVTSSLNPASSRRAVR